MLTVSASDISNAGGLLAAISAKSADFVAELLSGTRTRLPAAAARVTKLVTHANPHLDEYFAALVFRALLPSSKRGLVLGEAVLGSRDNDSLAQSTWPDAAVFGIGATENGGARPLILYDEHTHTGVKRKASSCSELTLKRVVEGFPHALPPELFFVFGEIDHIDANGGAHPQQLANAVKWLHDISFMVHAGATPAERISEQLSFIWKQALVDAAVVAALYVLRERIDLKKRDAWKDYAGDSLRHYKEHTLLRERPQFEACYQRLTQNVLGFPGRGPVWLTTRGADGVLVPRLDSHKREIPQRLVMPWLSRACVECWGPQLGHVILAHFWEATLMNQLSFVRIKDELTTVLGEGRVDVDVDTPVGELQFRTLSGIAVKPAGSADGNSTVQPWVLFYRPRIDIEAPKPPISNFIASKNQGVGIFAIVNPRSDTLVLSRGGGVSDSVWEAVIGQLVEREGDSDAKDVPGCWHITRDEKGKPADFLLNGNKAHQYVPRSALRDVNSLTHLVKAAYRPT
ncbi:MAG: hypothetical protein WB973_17060 [Thermoanaerobaculia bacterium]